MPIYVGSLGAVPLQPGEVDSPLYRLAVNKGTEEPAEVTEDGGKDKEE